MKPREILRASFNMTEAEERELYEFANSKGNVSKYLKRLILLDKEGVKHPSFAMSKIEVKEDEDEDMSSFT